MKNLIMRKVRFYLTNRGLSSFQVSVAELTSMGLSNAEIGNKLFIKEQLVKEKLEIIYKKLGIFSRAQLIVLCLPYMEASQICSISKSRDHQSATHFLCLLLERLSNFPIF